MIAQDQPFSLWTKGGSQTRALLFTKDDASKVRVHSLRIAVEIRHILVNHFQLARKSTPRLPGFAVAMACSRHVRSRLVDCRVYQKACRVGGVRSVSAHDFSVVVYKHHVGSLEGGEVAAEGVRPEGVRVLGIADAGRSRYHVSASLTRHAMHVELLT
jgi:hypothetical protein